MIEIFERTGKAIIEMQQENEELERKFGSTAKFVVKRKEQTEIIARFFDAVVDKINNDQKISFVRDVNYQAIKILFEQEADETYQEMAENYGFDKKDWKILDDLELKIEGWKNEIE